MDFVPRVKVEIVVTDDEAEAVIDAVVQAAHTGEVGDGRILVSHLESVIRVRTGEVDKTSAIDTSQRRESHEVSPSLPAMTPLSSEVWSAPRTFSDSDNVWMNYWARR